MKIQYIRAIMIGMVLAALTPIVLAAPPLIMDRFEDSGGPFINPDVSAACGFPVLETFKVKGKFTLFADNSSRLHVNRETVFSNATTGAELIETAVINQTSPPDLEIIDEDARTRTVIFMSTFNGVPLKWRQPGTGVLLRDAGTVTFRGTVVFDLDTGDFISFNEEIADLKGPHPSLFFDRTALGCGALQ